MNDSSCIIKTQNSKVKTKKSKVKSRNSKLNPPAGGSKVLPKTEGKIKIQNSKIKIKNLIEIRN